MKHFDWQLFEATLTQDLGVDVSIRSATPIGGGDISRAYHLKTNQIDFFAKLNTPDAAEMFRVEWSGLVELSSVESLRIPEPTSVGIAQNTAYFVMEWIDFSESTSQAMAGAAVADMHSIEHTRFGWDQNNFIGRSVQQNSWHADWAEFFWNCRLEPQLVAAVEGGFSILEKAIFPLREKTMALLEYHNVVPSLLHGDLWQGNIGMSLDSEILLYDPAVYWGDPETDIASTKLFGGFEEDFYKAYYQKIPLQEGADERQPLYQLYHWLNHLNLFGSDYLENCLNSISELYAYSESN